MSLVNRKGVLITCDVPTMQVIKFMDKQEGGQMIIKQLDERNVFIHKQEHYSACAPLARCLLLWGRISVLLARAWEGIQFRSLRSVRVSAAVNIIRERMEQMQVDNHFER